MRRRVFVIGIAAIVLVLGAGTGALYAYDSSRSDVIAHGITAGGVDIGGLNASAARDVLQRSLGAKVGSRIVVEWKNRRWTLEAADIGAHLNSGRMVSQALSESRTGNFVHRAFRDLRGKKVRERIPLRVGFAPAKLHTFIDAIAKQVNQKPVDADVHPTGVSLNVTPAQDGLAVQKTFLKYRIIKQLLSPESLRVALVPTRTLKPHMTDERLAAKYPAFITIDRANFTLRFWKNLKLDKTYTIAVGRQGLETPAGEYTIDDKQVNPSWHVPNSSWAGDLAGRVIPPGPDDPIKARWMGFYNGAGIHGTDEISSLGSAASHGCIRMAIPDVEELYPLVPLHTPIYVG
jgi:L,D-transpeptidase catalytic domain/Putative peptidoglycan binding domain